MHKKLRRKLRYSIVYVRLICDQCTQLIKSVIKLLDTVHELLRKKSTLVAAVRIFVRSLNL